MKVTFSSLWNVVKKDLWLKLLALVLSVLLWAVVVGYYNPETTKTFENIPVQVVLEGSIPEAEGLLLVTDLSEKTVDIRVEARRDVLALLTYDKITAKVDLSTVNKAGKYSSLPIRIDFGGQAAEVVSQSERSVALQFDVSKTAQVKVDVDAIGKVADGYVLARSAAPSVINVTGPDSIVSRIVSAKCSVTQDEFVETAKYTCDYIFADAEGNEVSHKYLTADYEQVEVTVSVNVEKVVPLQVELINGAGGNEAGYLQATVTPQTIKISGNAEAMAEINSITIGSLDVSKLREDYNESMNIILPNGIRNVDNVEQATVSVSFEQSVTKSFKVKNFRLENLPVGTKATVAEKSMTVRVRGVATDIEALKAEQMTVVVDCQNKTLATGNNSMAAYIVFPNGSKIGALGEYEVTLKVS